MHSNKYEKKEGKKTLILVGQNWNWTLWCTLPQVEQKKKTCPLATLLGNHTPQ